MALRNRYNNALMYLYTLFRGERYYICACVISSVAAAGISAFSRSVDRERKKNNGSFANARERVIYLRAVRKKYK